MGLKTDYPGHERAYQRLRERGQKGWSGDVEDNDTKRAWVRTVLETNFAGARPQVIFLGCGAGEFVIDAARAGALAFGIDVAPTAIEMAREDATAAGISCSFFVGSVLALPFDDHSLDMAVDDHCFHCIIGDDRSAFLKEAHRVLKPGGLFLVRSMCSVPDGVSLDPASRCQVTDGIATRFYGTIDGLLAEVRAADFSIIAHRVQKADPGGIDPVIPDTNQWAS